MGGIIKSFMNSNTMHYRKLRMISSEKSESLMTPISLVGNSGNFRPLDNYAIIEIGGVQKIVEEGRYYSCNRLPAEIGTKIRLGRVLAVKNEGKLHVGTPWLENASIACEILDTYLGDKVIVYKMKPKKHSRSKNGHRQHLTKFLVTNITLK